MLEFFLLGVVIINKGKLISFYSLKFIDAIKDIQ